MDVEQFAHNMKSGKSIGAQDGALSSLFEQLIEAVLSAEIDSHLTQDLNKNRKNGYATKTMKSEHGEFELDIPRDRLIGNFKLSMLSMIPNLTPIMFGVAFMVVFELPLDMFAILIGAIAIVMLVNDTIHYMHNFKYYYILHNDVDEAICLTLDSSGRVIFITSIVLSSGFLVFMFASMTNLFNFGLITGIKVIVAMLTNLTLTGVLMKLFIKSHADI